MGEDGDRTVLVDGQHVDLTAENILAHLFEPNLEAEAATTAACRRCQAGPPLTVAVSSMHERIDTPPASRTASRQVFAT